MKKFETLAEVLAFAISLEQISHDFYMDLSTRAGTDGMKQVFIGLATEEKLHKQRLEQIVGSAVSIHIKPVDSNEISKYVSAIPEPANMTYEQALKTAINKEHAAMMLYQILAQLTENKELRGILELLAVEETHHKQRFEKEYHELRIQKN